MNTRRKIPDLTGQKFGKWTVIEEAPRIDSHTCFVCRCECGSTLRIRADVLTRGKSKQCIKCARREYVKRVTNRTPEEVREYIQTHTVTEAAKHFGLTHGSMTRYMSRHGLRAVVKGRRVTPPRKPTESQRKAFQVALIPRHIPGVNDQSPHAERRWKYGGADYLDRMHAYERMVAK